MAVDLAKLLARFPEFEPATADMIDSAIAEAGRRIDASVWTSKADDGVLYLAAHLLAISPFGQQARLVSDEGASTYGTEHARMVREVSSGHRVI